MTKRIHVAVGIILNTDGQILLAKRPEHLHQGGKWEFPGGKVEQNETVTQALIRELKEEVALNVHSSEPFMALSYDYPDKQVLLDIHTVTDFTGEAQGLEGQQVVWVEKHELTHYDFPDANKPILAKLLAQN
ncbi:7,8-dihydro-8-oxoguanine-triphosphatase [Shewanella xiamenensis]|uniref:8-oxo-dGTP diphosphatase MutT n=1 Tax=Shewanella xiamenensis TaxID=332186 RepID=UPI0011866AF4|nr:8-oxo-dGTP diphosphatase MutT [Shewanella xiamenensis]TVL12434.1 7,8-dihydro-8-oxoguanine-triphosphatase [Shewanella xiamenensis]TVL12825.1 7,8-dihydro-8-oxoguanine-triphosphatase [Shewanella xiamenensis]TVL20360.1 7,8-dihydro-8-oxoguanine-triphosphatase [Shewanella xiamenensis]TVL25968.1 7,8-dihydro-8-oxoguanine-triphosphatase [Shewanella xiamenensis]TVO95213.1 7,8-dihydro-8-oxoguanine-triphosphatase [Shewanella xiamenensis]